MKRKLALFMAGLFTIGALSFSNISRVSAASSNSLSTSVIQVPDETVLLEESSASRGLEQIATSGDVRYKVGGSNLEIRLDSKVEAGDQFKVTLQNSDWFFRAKNSVSASNVNLAGLSADRLEERADYLLTQSSAVTENKINDVITELKSKINDYDHLGGSTGTRNDVTKYWNDVKSVLLPLTSTINAPSTLQSDLNEVGALLENLLDALEDSSNNSNTSHGNEVFDAIDRLQDKVDDLMAIRGLSPLPSSGTTASPSTERYSLSTSSGLGSVPDMTYDTNNGIWFANGTNSTSGTYYSYGTTNKGIAYRLEVLGSDDSSATVTILESEEYISNTSDRRILSIPLVSLTTSDNDLRVVIDSQLSSLTSQTLSYGTATSTSTNAYVNDPETDRVEFPIDKLIISENRVGSIRNGVIELRLPTGFSWSDSSGNLNLSNVVLNVDPGIGWNGNTSSGQSISNTSVSSSSSYTGFNMSYKTDGSTVDHSTIVVRLDRLNTSSQTRGAIYFTGLEVLADDDSASLGDIKASIRNVNYPVISGVGGTGKSEEVVTNQSNIVVGKRVDWAVSLSTTGEVPTLVNGRYEGSMSQPNDDYHKVAHIVFKENAAESWWSGRETYFTLPEGVKFRKVEFTNVDEVLNDNIPEESFLNTGKQQGKILLDGRQLKLTSISTSTDAAVVEFDAWVSIESGFEGDVTLEVSGAAVSGQDVEPIVLAKQVDPVTIETKVSDIKIGYQYYQTYDFTISETQAGSLLKSRQVRISLSDRINQDMYFTPDFTHEQLASNQKISTPASRVGGSATGSFGDEAGSFIYFDIESPSTNEPAVHKFSNINVKVDRTVPESSKPYELYVWGTAIARNYNTVGDLYDGTQNLGDSNLRFLDQFATPGISAPYVTVVSAANDKSSLSSKEVSVTIGEKFVSVNGEAIEMEAAAYISEESNSTMVPVRFVLNGLGIPDTQFLWDDSTHTVTIMDDNGKVVQFTSGSEKMIINGASITILSPDGLVVKTEITGDRMYLPFRALGDAFGIPVSWDDTTRTATYNKKEDTSTSTAETVEGNNTATA